MRPAKRIKPSVHSLRTPLRFIYSTTQTITTTQTLTAVQLHLFIVLPYNRPISLVASPRSDMSTKHIIAERSPAPYSPRAADSEAYRTSQPASKVGTHQEDPNAYYDIPSIAHTVGMEQAQARHQPWAQEAPADYPFQTLAPPHGYDRAHPNVYLPSRSAVSKRCQFPGGYGCPAGIRTQQPQGYRQVPTLPVRTVAPMWHGHYVPAAQPGAAYEAQEYGPSTSESDEENDYDC
jgi:hypothetical protein